MSYKTDFSKIDLDEYYYNSVAAEGVVRYIEENIRHVEGELSGQLLKLEEWQKDEIIKPLFGWLHKRTGLRKYKSAYIEIPKKNGKTFLSAALAAIFLDIETEPGTAGIYSVAGSKDQASLSFKATKKIILQSDRLSEKAEVYRHSIIVGEKFFQPMARDSKTQQGVNPQLCIVDELHIHQDGDLLENMEKSMAARRQPLTFIITTAGDNLYSIGYERHNYAIEVAKGKIIDENLLVCIYCAEKDDDWKSEKTWKKANPNYGVSVYPEFFEGEIKKAEFSPASLNSFKRYHLNIWTQTKEAWINDDVWVASESEFDIEKLKGLECYGGLDLAQIRDICALCLIFPYEGGYVGLNWFWLPEETVMNELEGSNREYVRWVEDKLITQTQGNTTDYSKIREKIMELSNQYKIVAIGYDPYNATETVLKLEENGMNMIKVIQNMPHMAPPTKVLEKAVYDKKFNHLGNPVLRWMAGNCVVTEDQKNNKYLTKDKSKPKQKIDGIAANVNGFAMILDNDVTQETSYLADEDLFLI